MREYGPPNSPPPKTKPKKPKISYIIDCINQYTYVWLKNGKTFWFYPTRIEQGEVYLVTDGTERNGYFMDWVRNL